MNQTVHETQLKTPPAVSVWMKSTTIIVLHVLDEVAGYATFHGCSNANLPFLAKITIWGHWKAHYQFRRVHPASFFSPGLAHSKEAALICHSTNAMLIGHAVS